MKRIARILNAPGSHWVGDGFPVRSLFNYASHGKLLSPFLLLDYAGPAHFEPTAMRRGVGAHPHRGFETVTIVYQGEVAHRDSTGEGGTIGPGDVQWMTAGAGILHDEYHGEAFAKAGGPFEMVQLWVNLPARAKMTPPAYHAITAASIPQVDLPGEAGAARIIAGELEGQPGPAKPFSPMQVWDLRLKAGRRLELPLAEGWTAALVVLRGAVRVNSETRAREAQVVVLERIGRDVLIEAADEATVLLLSGEPIDEPIVGYGPFVMNARDEIEQAISDLDMGRFGSLSGLPPSPETGAQA